MRINKTISLTKGIVLAFILALKVILNYSLPVFPPKIVAFTYALHAFIYVTMVKMHIKPFHSKLLKNCLNLNFKENSCSTAKMLSNRFYYLAYILSKVSCQTLANLIQFDKRDKLIHTLDNKKSIKLYKICFNFLVVWAFGIVGILIQAKIEKDLDSFCITIFYTIAGALTGSFYAFFRFYSEEFCRSINGLLDLFRHLHGTLLMHNYLNIYVSIIKIKILFFQRRICRTLSQIKTDSTRCSILLTF